MAEVAALLQTGRGPHVPHHVVIIHYPGPLLSEAAATSSVTSCGKEIVNINISFYTFVSLIHNTTQHNDNDLNHLHPPTADSAGPPAG